MKNEPFSIKRLLRPLKMASDQKMRRQDARNADISVCASSYLAAGSPPSEKMRRRIASEALMVDARSEATRGRISTAKELSAATATLKGKTDLPQMAGGACKPPATDSDGALSAISDIKGMIDRSRAVLPRSHEMEVVTVQGAQFDILQRKRVIFGGDDHIPANLAGMVENT
jgi:hypothetical protein